MPVSKGLEGSQNRLVVEYLWEYAILQYAVPHQKTPRETFCWRSRCVYTRDTVRRSAQIVPRKSWELKSSRWVCRRIHNLKIANACVVVKKQQILVNTMCLTGITNGGSRKNDNRSTTPGYFLLAGSRSLPDSRTAPAIAAGKRIQLIRI